MAKMYRTVGMYQSRTNSRKLYTVKADEQGNLSCNCPAWIYNKYGDRTCYHTKSVQTRFFKELLPQSRTSETVALESNSSHKEMPRKVRMPENKK